MPMKKKHCWENPLQNQHEMSQNGPSKIFAQLQNARLNNQAETEEEGFDVERDKILSLDTNIVNVTAESLNFLVAKIC